MLHRERRRRPRPTIDPMRGERDDLIAAVRGAERHGPGPTVEAMGHYAARARALGLEMAELVAEFRSVYDRAARRPAGDVRHTLRRERLVTQLVGLYLRTD